MVLIDTTSARAGETANITVTATDPTDGSTRTEIFKVTTTAYNGPTTSATVPINFVPFASPVTRLGADQRAGHRSIERPERFPGQDHSRTTQLQAPVPARAWDDQASSMRRLGHSSTRRTTDYFGPDTFQYQVISTGPKSTPAQVPSLPATVSVFVAAANTGAVRLIGDVLVVSPLAAAGHGKNTILVTQQADSTVTGGQKIVVDRERAAGPDPARNQLAESDRGLRRQGQRRHHGRSRRHPARDARRRARGQ